jgi:trehalose 6-phosphate phosphatase
MMQHLFQAWPEFLKDYRAASHLLFLSDFDGTLAVIVGRPDEAGLSSSVREKLEKLAQKPQTSVGIISGRSLEEIKAMAGIEGIYYSGNHGLEIAGPGLSYVHPRAEAARTTIKELADSLAKALRDTEGIIIQDKGYSVSVHYRLVKPEKENEVTDAVRRITEPHIQRGEIRVFPMKKVWEIRPPVDWDKGKSVAFIGREVKTRLGLSRVLTIYLGDDATDEDAFRVLHRPDGWAVYVGGENQKTAADYFLSSTAEVELLLGRLIDLKQA